MNWLKNGKIKIKIPIEVLIPNHSKRVQIYEGDGTHGTAPAYKLLGSHAVPSPIAEIASFVGIRYCLLLG